MTASRTTRRPRPVRATVRLAAAMLIAGGLAVAASVAEADTIRVRIADGRVLRGDALLTTPDANVLELRVTRPGIVMSRTLRRTDIVAVDPPEALPRPVSGSAASPVRDRLTPVAFVAQDAPPSVPVPATNPPAVPVPTPTPFVPPAPAFAPHAAPLPFGPSAEAPMPCGPPCCVVPCFHCDFDFGPWLAPPCPTRSVVIGVLDDPLEAYGDQIPALYPDGVPLLEVPAALELLRTRRLRQVWEAPLPGPAPNGPPRPGLPLDPARPPRPELPLPTEVPTSAAMTDDGSLPAPGALRAPPLAATGQLAGIVADAVPTSRFGREAWDAIAVQVGAVDRAGRPVPASGTLRITVWGRNERLERAVENETVGVPVRLVRLASNSVWATSIAAAGTDRPTAGGIVPLGAHIPEEDLRLGGTVDVHVEWAIAGAGVYDTVVRDVPLRRMSATEWQATVETGSPLLPGVHASGRRTATGLRYFVGSTVAPDRRFLAVQP